MENSAKCKRRHTKVSRSCRLCIFFFFFPLLSKKLSWDLPENKQRNCFLTRAVPRCYERFVLFSMSNVDKVKGWCGVSVWQLELDMMTQEADKTNACSRQHLADMFPLFSMCVLLCLETCPAKLCCLTKSVSKVSLSFLFFFSFFTLWCVVVMIEGLQGLSDTRVAVFVARDG